MDSSETPDIDLHGGDLAAAERRFGPPPNVGWLDLSTGISPFPYPGIELDANSLHRLPDSAALERLLEAARAYYGVPDGASITAAAGTQHLIQTLPRLISGARVMLGRPTYGEHEIAWRRAGRILVDAEPAEIAVLVNPNNPDGRIVGDWPSAATVIVDEAFGDVAPETSAVSKTAAGGVIVLKSFGKFFGLAGLRLGFCISSPGFALDLTQQLGPWAVSGPALQIGARALSDQAWIASIRPRLAENRRRLDAILLGAGFKILGGTDLFRLTGRADALPLYRHLGRAGILVRAFAGHPDWLRFGLPGSEANFARLETALADYARSSK